MMGITPRCCLHSIPQHCSSSSDCYIAGLELLCVSPCYTLNRERLVCSCPAGAFKGAWGEVTWTSTGETTGKYAFDLPKVSCKHGSSCAINQTNFLNTELRSYEPLMYITCLNTLCSVAYGNVAKRLQANCNISRHAHKRCSPVVTAAAAG